MLIVTLLLCLLTSQKIYIEATEPKRFIVEWKEVTDGTRMNFSDLLLGLTSAGRAAGLEVEKRLEFNTLLTGVSVEVNAKEGFPVKEWLEKLFDVKAVHPVQSIPIPKVNQSTKLKDAAANILLRASEVQQSLGFTGKGIKVGIIDTGIDYTHPALGGCFKKADCKVRFGYDFMGDDFGEGPDSDPMDCLGHGTHVAGIVAAKSKEMTGVAPDVILGAYKVFNCYGETQDDSVISAAEKAYEDGMQVINLSLGTNGDAWPSGVTSRALSKLVDRGVIVVVAAGNYGDNGIFWMGSPASGENVITVSSFDSTFLQLPTFNYSTGTGAPVLVPFGPVNPPSPFKAGRKYTVVAVDVPVKDGGWCGDPVPRSLKGVVALIRRAQGGCYPADAVDKLVGAGAIGAILYSSVSGSLTVTADYEWPIPVVSVQPETGLAIQQALAKKLNVEILFDANPKVATYTNPNGAKVNFFSSKGPLFTLDMKPDVGGTGGNIFSTWPLKMKTGYGRGYQVLSGTSMASPHVAGIAALLLQAKPKLNATSVRSILVNSARPQQDYIKLDVKSGVHHQGAGLADAYAAIQNSYIQFAPPRLQLGRAVQKTFQVTISNVGGPAMRLTPSHAPATSEQNNNGGLFDKYCTVSFSTTNVLVPQNGQASVNIIVTAPAGLPPITAVSGFILFKSNLTDVSYTVPYQGVTGYPSGVQVVAERPYLFNCDYYDPEECGSLPGITKSGTAFKISIDFPALYVQLKFGSRKATVTLFNADTNAVVQTYSQADLARMGSGYARFPIWVKRSQLKPGKFYATLTLVKPLGVVTNPDEIYVYTTPMFRIVK